MTSSGVVGQILVAATIAIVAALIVSWYNGNDASDLVNISSSSRVPKSVFISYSTLDRTDAFLLKRLLEEDGIKTWLDVFDIRTTGKIEDDLFGIIGEHDVFILLLSPNSVASPWVNQEIEVAKSISSLRLLPIILRPCKIPAQLEDIIGFDAREGLNSLSLQMRLSRAVTNSHSTEGFLLLDTAERELLHEKSLQDHAQRELPQVMRKLDEFMQTPMRSLTVSIKQASLPKDLDTVLEVALKLDPLEFHGTMSIFIARYQEGRTWPASLALEESTIDNYLLQPWPRIDVRFRYYNRNEQLSYIHGLSLPMTDIHEYCLNFDGENFQPQEELTIVQKYELPSLSTAVSQNSHFELKSHHISGGKTQRVTDDTDIWIEVFGCGHHNVPPLRLYRSQTSRFQRNILQTPYLSSPSMNPLVREALLNFYFESFGLPQNSDEQDMFKTIEKSLEDQLFDSDDTRRLAAYYSIHKARSLRLTGQNNAAASYGIKGIDLLWGLMHKGEIILEDVTYVYKASEDLARVHLQAQDLSGVDWYLRPLLKALEFAVIKAPEEVDLRRMWSRALFWKATVDFDLGIPHETALIGLRKSISLLLDINSHAPSPSNWLAAVGILKQSIELYHKNKVDIPTLLELWQNTMRPLVPSEHYEDLIAAPTPPDQLPVWLVDTSLDEMSMREIKSGSSRYSLQIPDSWQSNYKLRGTHMETEHIYFGPSDAQWLMIGFTDKFDPPWDMKTVINAYMALNGALPFLSPLEKNRVLKVVKGSNEPLSLVPSLVTKLNASDGWAMRGVCEVTSSAGPEEPPTLARYYVLHVRKETFAWRITLCIDTKLPPIALERHLETDDHLRAGAILGRLQLSGPSEQLP